MLSHKNLPIKIKKQGKDVPSAHMFDIVLEVLVNAIRQGKEEKTYPLARKK